MGTAEIGLRGLGRAVTSCVFAAMLVSCANAPSEPAPVYMRGAGPGPNDVAGPLPAPPSRAQSRRAPGYITVQPGQSLGGIAHSYHVPEREIIAANHLKPPYKLESGMRLKIPGSGVLPPETATEHAAAVPPVPVLPPAPGSADVIPLDGPVPPKTGAASPVPLHPAATPPPPTSPAAAAVAAEVARETGRPAPTIAPPTGPKATFPAEREEENRAEAAAPAAMHGGRFPWPVRGRVVAGYGAEAGGAHNDGINIAAARGTPIKAIEGGVVAYAGNELRGYGNLVLVKHPDGLISAYAHCDELLVKKGERIAPGQVIGRVGATGGVSEPQLHFELRRGKHPIDPREFLGSGPSAGRDASAG